MVTPYYTRSVPTARALLSVVLSRQQLGDQGEGVAVFVARKTDVLAVQVLVERKRLRKNLLWCAPWIAETS